MDTDAPATRALLLVLLPLLAGYLTFVKHGFIPGLLGFVIGVLVALVLGAVAGRVSRYRARR